MIHAVVRPGNWTGHCRYYYPPEFVEQLSKLFAYKIVRSERFNPYSPPKRKRYLTMTCLQKVTHKNISRLQFEELSITDTHNEEKTGNYTTAK